MSNYYPPVGYHFEVVFNNLPGEYQFQSVSGFTVDIETELVSEGGENRFKHKIPVRTKFPNLVLKRGLFVDSELIDWCIDAIENLEIAPTDLTVILLNEKHDPLMTWNIVHAYPVKWSVTNFDAEQSTIAIETIELSYQYFNII